MNCKMSPWSKTAEKRALRGVTDGRTDGSKKTGREGMKEGKEGKHKEKITAS